MGQFKYTLAVLLALLRPNIAEPYGRLGCRFSPVCEEQEVCVEDKLFGTCTQLHSPYAPSYKLDNVGLHKLKSTIRYLINSGYAWDDKYAQDSLRTVLDPYKLEDLDSEQVSLQAYIAEWLTEVLEDELAIEYVTELAKDYQAVADQTILQQLGLYKRPYKGYNEKNAGYYGYGQAGTGVRDFQGKVPQGEESQGEESQGAESQGAVSQGKEVQGEELPEVDLGYLADVAREYLQYANKVQSAEKDSLHEMYQIYLEKYKDALRNAEDDQGMFKLPGVDQQGGNQQGGNNIDQDDWRILQKLQRMKEDMQTVYQEHQGKWQDVSESDLEGAFMSDSEMMMGQDVESSHAQKEVETEDLSAPGESVRGSVGDSWGPIIAETVTPSKIEELVPSETESALNELFGSYMYDQEQWNKLTNEQREELLNKMLSALGLLEQSSLGSAADVFDSESQEDDESPVEMGNKVMEITIPTGVVEKKAKQDDGPVEGDNYQGDAGSYNNPPQAVDVGVPDDNSPTGIPTESPTKPTPTKPAPKEKHTTEPPNGYVFIALFSRVTQHQGEILVEELANLLEVPQSSFSEIVVNDKTITFKVDGTIMSTQDIAELAASFKQDFREEMGVTITATGVGRETHVKVLETPTDDNPTLVVLTVVLVACVLGILIAVITVYCFRQKVKIKQKLQGLQGAETEASTDYQDLCRQRMASKSSEKPEPLSRISSVAMSEGAQPSPSSRSSTSSWSEEPVQSNMDISTGHVVLSYMEDHLKNKDRLHVEWEALVNYEADMCSTKVGTTNPSKNRYKDVLPYDHTRVILNDTRNNSRSDYINASSITDSDPRSPAYIATQAPQPNTLADFWQMVWEQGSVVIVNLCKLTENDVSKQRYWPEEGSALYHIYEVHLVSEHVWCEDYLVRSFYLKNLETDETRTVTQFHFLTWPENGVPPSPKAALEFRRKVNKSYRGRACPIVVHCSDGIGRTGTYCLMDMVLTRMTKGTKEIDIAATLEHILDQRPGMVKNKDQFEFALQAVAEEVNAILKALPQ